MNRAAPLDLPLWEWRTFAASRNEFQGLRLGAPGAAPVVSHEISILCGGSLHDVVVQESSLRLKWRKEVGPGGLELWDPVLTASFPIPASAVLRLFEAWGLASPLLAQASYSRAEFLERVLPLESGLRAVAVAKRTESHLLDGVRCDLISLSADHVSLECVAIEHEDPELTLQVLRRLGLLGRGNTSYSQGLKQALQFTTLH
jgi:hypothetical protein